MMKVFKSRYFRIIPLLIILFLVGFTTTGITEAKDISDYISSIYIYQVWDYGSPTDSTDLMYEFCLEISSSADEAINIDADVAGIEFLTPAGYTFHIPKQPGQWSGGIWTSYEYEYDPEWEWGWATWEYKARFQDLADLQAYGDGEYTITVHYSNGSHSQTTAWCNIPQPTQEPMLTFSLHNQAVESPVTFTWEPCDDPNVEVMWVDIQDKTESVYAGLSIDVNEAGWPPVSLTEGIWEIEILFAQYEGYINNQGIWVDVDKYSKSKYEFTILDYPYTKYEVWGGDIYLGGDYFPSRYLLESNGYVKLGESEGQIATFHGEYKYYIIPTLWQFLLDSVQGSDGSYLTSDLTHRGIGNVTDVNNIFGPSDGLCATVGKEPWCGDIFSGYFLFNNPGNWEGLTVITKNLNISKSITNTPEELENIGPGDTITYKICFDSNDLIDTVTDVTVVDILPEEVSFVSADTNEFYGFYDPNEHTFTWVCPSLAPESAFELPLTVLVNPDIAPDTVITNFVTINSNETLPTTAKISVSTQQANNSQLRADFTSDVTEGGRPLTVHFYDQSNGYVTSWLWDFGDDEISIEQNPIHTYKTAGLYTVSLSVTDPSGTELIVKQDYISVTEPLYLVADFTAEPTQGEAPLTVQFTDKSQCYIFYFTRQNDTLMGLEKFVDALNYTNSWEWDFGDGKQSTERNPSHTYELPGTYTVSLTIQGSCGTDTKIRMEYITVNLISAPIAQFIAEPRTGTVPLTVQFADQSIGKITSWLWNFGDGQSSTEQNPSHTYQTPGIYTLSLTVTGPGGNSRTQTNIKVETPQAQLVTVQLQLSKYFSIWGRCMVIANVTLTRLDNPGVPLQNATVQGHWSGAFNGNATAVTDENGIALFWLGWFSEPKELTFTLDSVTLGYQPCYFSGTVSETIITAR